MDSKMYPFLFSDEDNDFRHYVNMAIFSKQLAANDEIEIGTYFMSNPNQGRHLFRSW